jgi:hypothetical protein
MRGDVSCLATEPFVGIQCADPCIAYPLSVVIAVILDSREDSHRAPSIVRTTVS